MRKLPEVIDQMLLVVPVEEENFINCLLDIKSSSCYSPPESQYLWWGQGAELFDNYFKVEPTEGWGKEAIDIWMDRK